MNIAMDYSRLKLEFAAVRSTNSLLHDVESKIVAACVQKNTRCNTFSEELHEPFRTRLLILETGVGYFCTGGKNVQNDTQ